jgi:hypothetical protein
MKVSDEMKAVKREFATKSNALEVGWYLALDDNIPKVEILEQENKELREDKAFFDIKYNNLRRKCQRQKDLISKAHQFLIHVERGHKIYHLVQELESCINEK